MLAKNSTKLFRSESIPDFASEVSGSRKAYRHSLSLDAGGEVAVLRYHKSRWNPLSFESEELSERELTGWIEIEGRCVGVIELYEYRATDFLDNSSLFELMDSKSGITSELASTLVSNWRCVSGELLELGTIIDFRKAWTDPRRCPAGLWASAANNLIAKHCPTHSLLILKAFPLEYECREDGRPELAASRMRRQEAMKRHYRKLLGVTRFPNAEEWMYRVNPKMSDVICAPR